MFTARFILFGIVLAQLADAATFMVGVSRFGIGLESNRIAAGIYHLGGTDAVLLVKGVIVLSTNPVRATPQRMHGLNVFTCVIHVRGGTASSLARERGSCGRAGRPAPRRVRRCRDACLQPVQVPGPDSRAGIRGFGRCQPNR